MPIDYSKYPPNWKKEIRPRILERDGHKCKFCNVPNKAYINRGMWMGVDVWQDDNGAIYNAATGEYMTDSYVGDVWVERDGGIVKIVLTIAHLNHDVTDNRDENLAALCQRCHLHLDKDHHRRNASATIKRKKLLQELFLDDSRTESSVAGTERSNDIK